MYHVKCSECGWETDMMKSDAKRTSECRHRGFLTQEQVDEWYEKNKRQCLYCGKDIPLGDLSFSEYKERKFCNSSCAASYNNTKRTGMTYNKTSQETKRTNDDGVKIALIAHQISKSHCKNCKKEVEKGKQFCSQDCFNQFKYNEYIQKWKDGVIDGLSGYNVSKTIRRYLFEKYDNKCAECGWNKINPTTGKIPLEVHHKDGNYKHNTEDNLTLLCPNCHSLTPTYRAINKGNGRKDRRKYDLH